MSAHIKSKVIPGVSVTGRGLSGVLTPSRMALVLVERAVAESYPVANDERPSSASAVAAPRGTPRRPEPLSPADLLLL